MNTRILAALLLFCTSTVLGLPAHAQEPSAQEPAAVAHPETKPVAEPAAKAPAETTPAETTPAEITPAQSTTDKTAPSDAQPETTPQAEADTAPQTTPDATPAETAVDTPSDTAAPAETDAADTADTATQDGEPAKDTTVGADDNTPRAVDEDVAEKDADTGTGTDTSEAVVVEEPNKLTIATYGGAYGQALQATVLDPFSDSKKIPVQSVYHSRQDQALSSIHLSDPTPDVIELDRQAIDAACDAGLIAKRSDADSASVSATNKKTANRDNGDSLDGALHPCGVASLTWSAVTVFNTKAFKKAQPRRLSDLFNTRKFPGKRAFVARPEFLFETILMAEGVKASKVYSTLETERGVKRVLRRLTRLSKHITWANSQTEALELIATGQAVLGQGFNGRVFFDSARGAPVAIVWDGQIYDTNYYAIPSTAENPERSLEFVSFATTNERLAQHAQELAYGPMKRAAIAQISTHPTLDIELAPYMPTHPKNRKRALRRDAAWWAVNGTRLKQQFANWQADIASGKAQAELNKSKKKVRRSKKRKKRRYRRRR